MSKSLFNLPVYRITQAGRAKLIWSWFITAALLSVNAGAQSSYTIFQPADGPQIALNNDQTGGIEIGFKFRATQNGTIDGIRYYKGTGTTGVHKAHLWTSSGSMLAEATFSSETASGWQQVLFATPVPIDAGVTYVASCHSASGDYASTASYFAQAVINGSLKALADNEDGRNGVYKYTSTPAFPTDAPANGSNYWVDIVFTPGSAGGGNTINGTFNYIPKFTAPNAIGNSIVYDNGSSVGIGTTTISNPDYKLFVATGVRTKKIKVDLETNWPDYVFDDKYELPSLQEVEKYIKEHKRLPEVPSAKKVAETGLNLGDNQALLLKKIEELTLYLIEQNKVNEQMKIRVNELEEKIQKLSGAANK